MSSKNPNAGALTITTIAFVVLVISMGLDGMVGVVVTGCALLMFVVALIVSVSSSGRAHRDADADVRENNASRERSSEH